MIEGACRHLVKDRLDLTGARWGLNGAEAILNYVPYAATATSTSTGGFISTENVTECTRLALRMGQSRWPHDVPLREPHPIENMGNTCLLFDASAPVGWLSEPGGSVALGGHAGKIAASLQHMKLEPGAVGELSFIVGTADLGPSVSFLLSPGHYEVVVPVHVIMSSEHTEGVPRVMDLQVRDCYLSISDPLR